MNTAFILLGFPYGSRTIQHTDPVCLINAIDAASYHKNIPFSVCYGMRKVPFNTFIITTLYKIIRHEVHAMRRFLPVLVLTFAVCAGMWLFSKRETVKQVKCITPTLTSVTFNISAKGTIEQICAANLYPSEYATVDKIYVNIGDPVKKGQVIMSLLPTDINVPGKQDMTGLFVEVFSQTVKDESNYASYSKGFLIISPIDGIITEMNVKEMETVSPISKCAVVSDISRMQAKVAVAESDISEVKKGMPVSITGEAFKGVYKGVVIEISRQIKSQVTIQGEGERYAVVVVEILNPDQNLLPGSSIQAYIYTKRKLNVLTLPYEAITQDEQNREVVYTVEDGKVRKRIIKTGYEMPNTVEIKYGVNEASYVVLSPDDSLAEGDRAVIVR